MLTTLAVTFIVSRVWRVRVAPLRGAAAVAALLAQPEPSDL